MVMFLDSRGCLLCLRWGVVVLGLLGVLLFFGGTYDGGYGGVVLWWLAIFVGLLSVLKGSFVKSGCSIGGSGYLCWYVYLFIVWLCSDRGQYFDYVMLTYCACAAFYLYLVSESNWRGAVLSSVVSLAVVVVAVSLIQLFTASAWHPLIDGDYTGRVAGVFGQANSNAAMLNCVFVLALWLISFGGRWRFGGLVLCLISSYLLFATGSRGGVIGLAVVSVGSVVLWSRQSKLKMTMAVCCVCVLSFLLFTLSNSLMLDRMESGVSGGASVGMRVVYYTRALELWWGSPFFGVGVGEFMWQWDEGVVHSSNEALGRVHSDFLDILCELGGVGLLLFALPLSTLIWKGMFKEGGRNERCAGIALLGLSVHGMFDFHLRVPSLMLVATICVFLIVRGEMDNMRWVRSRALICGLTVIVFLVSVKNSAWAQKYWSDAHIFNMRAMNLLKQGFLPPEESIQASIASARRAIELYPNYSLAWAELGRSSRFLLMHDRELSGSDLERVNYCFEEAYSLSGGFWQWRFEQAVTQTMLPEMRENAIGGYEQALRDRPGRMRLYLAYATFLMSINQHDKAQDVLTFAVNNGSAAVRKLALEMMLSVEDGKSLK